jgi:hypothetical protein
MGHAPVYREASWLESGERVERALRTRANENVDGGIVTHMIHGESVLTNRRSRS